MAPTEIACDGFTYTSGQFYAKERVEQIDATRLKALFLPRVSPGRNALLQRHRDGSFVRGQLQQYGLDCHKRYFSGNDIPLLRKMLQAGL